MNIECHAFCQVVCTDRDDLTIGNGIAIYLYKAIDWGG